MSCVYLKALCIIQLKLHKTFFDFTVPLVGLENQNNHAENISNRSDRKYYIYYLLLHFGQVLLRGDIDFLENLENLQNPENPGNVYELGGA
jgi:hypothetical protein